MTITDVLKKYWWGFGLAIVAVFVVFWLIAQNNVVNEGNKRQQDLIVFYNDTTNVLSDCLVKTKQSIGATEAQTRALDKVITDAVRGRYTEGSTAQPGAGNPLYSAMVEAYPDTRELSRTFQDVLVVINGCRTNFRDSQSELQRAVSRFNQWRTGSWTVRTFGGNDYPNDDLEIEVNNRVVTGKEALRQMRELVVVSEAQTGRDSGEIENNDPFENSD